MMCIIIKNIVFFIGVSQGWEFSNRQCRDE